MEERYKMAEIDQSERSTQIESHQKKKKKKQNQISIESIV